MSGCIKDFEKRNKIGHQGEYFCGLSNLSKKKKKTHTHTYTIHIHVCMYMKRTTPGAKTHVFHMCHSMHCILTKKPMEYSEQQKEKNLRLFFYIYYLYIHIYSFGYLLVVCVVATCT